MDITKIAGAEGQPARMHGVAARKLAELQSDGWTVDGVGIRRPSGDTMRHGLVTAGGRVLWWWWHGDQNADNKQIDVVCADIASRQSMGIYSAEAPTYPACMRDSLRRSYEHHLDTAVQLRRAIAEIDSRGN